MVLVFVGLFVLLFLGVPIAYSIGLAAIFGLVTEAGVPLTIVPQRMFGMLHTFSLLAIPLFILAGNLMDRGGISQRLIGFAASLVGHIRGGLAMVSILGCMLFGAISGSGAAASAAIGGITIPAMKDAGYDKEFAGAITALSGPLGIIIPPSVLMIVFATTAEVSIGNLFIAGYIPGLLLGLAMMITVNIIARRRGYPAGEKTSLRGIAQAFFKAIWALGMIFIIIGGIFGGFFTATEAAAVSVFYALFVGLFIYRNLKLKDLPDVLKRSAMTSAAVMFCVAATNILAFLITRQQIPMHIGNALSTVITSRIAFLLLCNLIFLILGVILDSTPAVILAVPILLPIARTFGVDPTHFGIITIVNLAIGMSTPPVGLTLFVSSKIAQTSLTSMIKPMLPLWSVMFGILLLITFVPDLSLFLVRFLAR